MLMRSTENVYSSILGKPNKIPMSCNEQLMGQIHLLINSMNESETEIEIIQEGWTRVRVIVGDTIKLLPSDELLNRLIRFPKSVYPDYYNLEKFRIRPQVFYLKSQLILQERSNLIVEYILGCQLTAYEMRIVKWCEEHGRNPTLVLFDMKLMLYCEQILPGLNPNPKKDRVIAAISRSVGIDGWTPKEKSFQDKYKRVNWAYWDRRKRDEKSLMNRFLEYGQASGCVNSIVRKIGDESIYLDEYDRINKENDRYNRLRNKPYKYSKKGDCRVFTNNFRILTQCLFCYKFHLQDPKPPLSRHCESDKCKSQNYAWENSLDSGDALKQGGVPLSGF